MAYEIVWTSASRENYRDIIDSLFDLDNFKFDEDEEDFR